MKTILCHNKLLLIVPWKPKFGRLLNSVRMILDGDKIVKDIDARCNASRNQRKYDIAYLGPRQRLIEIGHFPNSNRHLQCLFASGVRDRHTRLSQKQRQCFIVILKILHGFAQVTSGVNLFFAKGLSLNNSIAFG